MKKEFTEAETKYVVSFVLQKIVKTVTDQMKITVHFVMKNDPLAGEGLFGNIDNVNDINIVNEKIVCPDVIQFIGEYLNNKSGTDLISIKNKEQICKNISSLKIQLKKIHLKLNIFYQKHFLMMNIL